MIVPVQHTSSRSLRTFLALLPSFSLPYLVRQRECFRSLPCERADVVASANCAWSSLSSLEDALNADELHRHSSALTLFFVAACPGLLFFSLPHFHIAFAIVTVSGGYRVSQPTSMPPLTAHSRCSLPHPFRHEACDFVRPSSASTVFTTAVVLGF